MGEIRINLTNFLSVGLMAFVFLFIVRKAAPMVPVSFGSDE